MSVDIISLALSSSKTDLRRYLEKLSVQYVFHCLRLFVIKKCAVLKFFRKNIVYLQILSSYIEVFIFNLYNKIFYEYYT